VYLVDTDVISELRKKETANPGVVAFFKEASSSSATVFLLLTRMRPRFGAVCGCRIRRTRSTSRSRPPRSFTILSWSRATSSTLEQRA